MTIKRILSSVLALALVASLGVAAGCKKTDSADKDNNSGKTVDKIEDIYGSSDLSAEVIEALQNSGEITVYTMYADVAKGNLSDDDKEMNEFFKNYYGLTFNYRYQAYGDDLTKFLVDYAANDAPDLISLDYRRWPKAGLRQIVYSTDELKNDLKVVGLDHPAITRYADLDSRFNIGGKIYGLSVSVCVPVVCGVNLDLFDEYKVKSPVEYYKEGTWNTDAYIKCAKEITRTRADGSKIWGCYGWNYNWYLAANDAHLVTWGKNNTLVLGMSESKVMRSLNMIHELYAKEYTPTSELGGETLFFKGQMGTVLMTSNNFAQKAADCTFKWEIVPMPFGADNTSGLTAGEMDSIGVVTSTKNAQGVINYLIAKGAYADYKYGKENGLYYRPVYEGVYSKDQLSMIYTYADKISQDLVMGVGTLGKSYKFWNDLHDDSKTVKECIDTWEPMYAEQVQLENEQAKAAK